jgi:ATP/maltotriose-dependent transcriptional regulator MalT
MWLEASERRSAWISLDEDDNDLGTFTGYLVAALQRAFPDTKLETQALLQAPAMPPAPVVARYLLNDLEQIDEPFILALDDVYERLTPAKQEWLLVARQSAGARLSQRRTLSTAP